jgi:hypothetical protein
VAHERVNADAEEIGDTVDVTHGRIGVGAWGKSTFRSTFNVGSRHSAFKALRRRHPAGRSYTFGFRPQRADTLRNPQWATCQLCLPPMQMDDRLPSEDFTHSETPFSWGIREPTDDH